MSVVGVVHGQATIRSPGLRAPAEKKKKVEEKKPSSKSGKSDKPTKSSSSQSTTASTDSRIDDLESEMVVPV